MLENALPQHGGGRVAKVAAGLENRENTEREREV
jgi:hypothetical protein